MYGNSLYDLDLGREKPINEPKGVNFGATGSMASYIKAHEQAMRMKGNNSRDNADGVFPGPTNPELQPMSVLSMTGNTQPLLPPPEISSEPGNLMLRSNLYPQEQLVTIPPAVKSRSLEKFNLESSEHGKRRRGADSSAPLPSLTSGESPGQHAKKARDPNSEVVLSSERAIQRTRSAQDDLFGNERYNCELNFLIL